MKDPQTYLQNNNDELPEFLPFLIAVISVLLIFVLITHFTLISFISIFSVFPLIFMLPFMPLMNLLAVPFMSPQDLMLISNPTSQLPLQAMTQSLLHTTMYVGMTAIATMVMVCVISYITKPQQQQEALSNNVKTNADKSLKNKVKSPKAITPHLNHILSQNANPLFSRKDKLNINSVHKRKLR